MGKPLNWELWAPPEKKSISRSVRKRLALTTILAVAPFLNYGRPTYAACVGLPSPTITCSDTITGDSIIVDNADVETAAAPPFVVTTDGLYIRGDGDISFTDNNASSITNTGYGAGLTVISTGDIGEGADGAVTIVTNGTITGENGDGIYAYNQGSGDLNITADGTVTGEPGGEDSVASDGIYALNNGNNLFITTGAQSVITGDDNAIDARNYGSGDLEIEVNGQAKSTDFDGIFARNYGDDLKVTIGAQASVDGAGNGINAQNVGEGALDITVDGAVTGRDYDGVRAYNTGTDLTVTAGAQSVILGDDNGIDARNFGEGDLKITADGVVTGYTNDGIYAVNVSGDFYNPENGNEYTGYGRNLIITTGAQSVVRGGGHGIGARNFGSGNLTIEANGWVGGYGYDSEDAEGIGDGINAFNDNSGGSLTITTGLASTVRGTDDGISARNQGGGGLAITAEGAVTGFDGSGIYARNDYGSSEDSDGEFNGLSITTGADSDVFGGKDGIDAVNFGNGFLRIDVNGQVTGEGLDGSEGGFDGGDGVHARNYGTGLVIETGSGSVVTGLGDDGIEARQYGAGDLTITVNGSATGQGEDGSGINAFNDGGFGCFAASACVAAIPEPDPGSIETIITVGADGLAQGSYAGIRAISGSGQNIFITNDGLVRNLSAESSDQAIRTRGGVTYIENNADLIGTVLLDKDTHFDDVLNNAGFWNSANGTSDFGFGEDAITNTGLLTAADDPTDAEETSIAGVETFSNDGGLISMIDGQAGDLLFLSGDNPGALSYTGTNGLLGVDAELGPAGFSDEMNIDGDTFGTTLVHVNVVGAAGANLVGIPVVRVTNGDTVEENFNLDGPLNAGFFTWDLRLDGNTHELFTTGVSGSVGEFAAGITGAQDIWHQSLGTLLQRQADLRALLGGMAVTPVADFAEPVEPTPVAHVTPGFWLRGVGAWLERDGEEDGFTLDRKQTIWGALAGFDFGTEDAGQAWMFGLFGGYLTSDLEFDETNTEWNYEGPTVGVYATYMDDAFYANATVKADFLDIEIDPEDLAPDADDADTDALNIGGLFDTGYKFGQQFFIEPQASLAVVHTEIDDVDIFGGTVDFDDETSIRGRLGLRVGVDHTGSNQVVYSSDVTASVWEEFAGDNDISITDPAFGSFGGSDDAGGTYGDVSLGFSMANPEGWSSFIRGNYQFGEDFEAFAGNAGVRYAF